MAAVRFEVVGEIAEVETIAVGRSIRDLPRLRKVYGSERWRKMKGSRYHSIGQRAHSACGSSLVRGSWDRSEGTQAQTIPERELTMPKSSQPRFAVCIDNSGYPASLERHKIYRVLPDKDAANDGDLRVIDESGEDYLYEGDRFLLVDLPPRLVRILNRSFASAGANAR